MSLPFVLDAEQVASALDSAQVFGIAAAALVEADAGRTSPPAVWLPTADGRIQVKAAYYRETVVLRTAQESSGTNQHSASRVMTCFRRADLAPLGFVHEGELFAQRVAAQAHLAWTSLTPDAGRILLIGGGRVARAIVRMADVLGLLAARELVLHTRRPDAAMAMLDDLAVTGAVVDAAALPAAIAAADVVITATSSPEPLVPRRALSRGTLVVSLGGGAELEDRIVLEADRLVVDDWEQASLMGDLAPLIASGLVTRQGVSATLAEVLRAPATHRVGHGELVVAVAQGSTVIDAALAHHLVSAQQAGGLGGGLAGGL